MKSVVVDLNELISRIKADRKIQKKIEEPLSINIFSADKSITGVNRQFVFSQLFIDCLLRLKSTQIDKNELMNCCKNQYEGNHSFIKHLMQLYIHKIFV